MGRWFLNKITKCTWDISDESLIKRLLNEPDIYEEVEDPTIEKAEKEITLPEKLEKTEKQLKKELILQKAREARKYNKGIKNE